MRREDTDKGGMAAPNAQLKPLKFSVSFARPAFVRRVKAAAQRDGEDAARDRRVGPHGPGDNEDDDELDDDTYIAAQRLQPMLEDFAADRDTMTASIEEAEARMREHRATEDDAPPSLGTSEAETASVDRGQMYLAVSRGRLVPRDPQFDLLRKWYLRSAQPPPTPAFPECYRDGDSQALLRRSIVPTPAPASGADTKDQFDADTLETVLDLSDRFRGAMNLTSLTLTGFRIGAIEMHALATRLLERDSAGQLVSLAFPSCGISTAAMIPLCEHLTDNTTLKSLDLSYNAIDEVGCKALEIALQRSCLERLSVRGNKVNADMYSTSVLYLLLGNQVRSIDIGFTNLGDNSIVKLCTVLRSLDCSVEEVIVDGAEISPRVALMLLDTVCETKRVTQLSVKHIYSCHALSFGQRLETALAKNRRIHEDVKQAEARSAAAVAAEKGALGSSTGRETAGIVPDASASAGQLRRVMTLKDVQSSMMRV